MLAGWSAANSRSVGKTKKSLRSRCAEPCSCCRARSKARFSFAPSLKLQIAELGVQLHNLKIGKVPGPNDIHAEYLQRGPAPGTRHGYGDGGRQGCSPAIPGDPIPAAEWCFIGCPVPSA